MELTYEEYVESIKDDIELSSLMSELAIRFLYFKSIANYIRK